VVKTVHMALWYYCPRIGSPGSGTTMPRFHVGDFER